MQSKATIIYHCIPIRIVKITRLIIPSIDNYAVELEH